jgi:RNA polymerase sigma-70 factor (ECF subfamily)
MPVESKTDEQLMVTYAAGNLDAFEELFRRYGTKIYNLFLRYERNVETARDLLQECFLRVIEAKERYTPTKAFSSWLYTIAMNLLRDRQRQKRRRKVQHFSEVDEAILPASEADAKSDPDHVLEKLSIKESVENALHTLPHDQKETILLSKYHGLSFMEIGQILNISAEAAKQKAYRGMQKLREQLAHLKRE